MQLADLKGLGPKRLALLKQNNIRTPNDLLLHFPATYIDNSVLTPVAELREGETFSVQLRLTSGPSFFSKHGFSIVSFYGVDKDGKTLAVRWYNQIYRSSSVAVGNTYIFCGRVQRKSHQPVSMLNPSVSNQLRGIIPVYSGLKGISNSLVRSWIETVLKDDPLSETLPYEVIERFDLMPLEKAVSTAHFPETQEDLSDALRRLRFERALLYFIFLFNLRSKDYIQSGIAFSTVGAMDEFLSTLPYAPTSGQLAAMKDITLDMEQGVPMNRIIQGDVGCGKTMVAEYAAYIAFRSGKQCVMMAPTEILATQQYNSLFNRFGCSCGLLTGNIDVAERRQALECIRTGKWRIIVGTHALFSTDVIYCDLGLVITDEQHRFGVKQRGQLIRKGIHPDVLVMSATPIPRTMALILYGDLDVSFIRDMPPGRLPIKTYLINQEKRDDMYKYLAEEALSGKRSYVVCPLIDQNENSILPSAESVYSELQQIIPNTRIGLLHGRMSEKDKTYTMKRFASGELDVLVSTTVIEVGINVPEAVNMVIEGADRFGLSTLHQLRGRVGRGSIQGQCFLLTNKPSNVSLNRLKVMLSTTDGFSIAEQDMANRGTGDLLGVRQSGEGDSLSLLRESGLDILEEARTAAHDILSGMTTAGVELLERAESIFDNSEVALN